MITLHQWLRRCLPNRGLALALSVVGSIGASTPGQAQATLAGRAVLPAATFRPAAQSGQFIGASPINFQPVPFTNSQPVQGFSATLANGDGTYLVMSDNGYGSLENSADYHLTVYRMAMDFKSAAGGAGNMQLQGQFELSDPNKHVPFTITREFTEDRILTGADFDIESMQRAPDGTLWFGDEFGPYLLHTDSTGKLLEPPIALPDYDNPGKEIRSPQNPMSEESSVVRIMNAVRHHAWMRTNNITPVFSPWELMIDDNNTNTFVENRLAAPAGSGLKPASSEIFNVGSLQRAGYQVVTWTVNSKPRMLELMRLGVNGIISDRPDLLLEAAREFDKNQDGKPGDLLDADGLIDIAKFDAQGHRGARNLRPENTLPAMEVALDTLMTTLELDLGVTKDGVPILSHDPYVESAKNVRLDGAAYGDADEVLIKNLTAAEIQSTFACVKLFRGPTQTNDLALSPVSVAFAQAKSLKSAYVLPTLQQVFEFVETYTAYYSTGAGKTHPEAALRAKNAARVRFNVETKLNPRTDKDLKNNVFAERTIAPEPFATAVASVILSSRMSSRADIQSFDFRTLLAVQSEFPGIRTVYLFGDFPKYTDPTLAGSDDGTNLQDQEGQNTPWLAGLKWPYRATRQDNSFRSQRSGGFEGMALSADRQMLLPLLEKPLVGGEAGTLLIHEFDTRTRKYTGVRYKYPLHLRGTAIGDFQMFDAGRGLVIEREDSQADLNGFKAIYEITLAGPNRPVTKRLAVDLLNIVDSAGLSAGGDPGDVGTGFDYAYPYATTANVLFMNPTRLLVMNDNSYPLSLGRHVGTGMPDDNEAILIDLDKPLGNYNETAPSTTIPAYYPPSPAAAAAGFKVDVRSLVTVADPGIPSIGGYKMAGLPDGLGLLDNVDGTFSVFMNHELRGGDLPGGLGTITLVTNATTGVITTNNNAAVGVVRTHGGKGAFVSEWVFDKRSLAVVRAGDLIKAGGLNIWDNGAFRPFNPTNDFHISRLCSADLPAESAFFNAATGKGTRTRIFMNGEEDGAPRAIGGRAFAHLVSGNEKGTSYELPYLGKFAWENSVASPFAQDATIVMGLDDSDLTNSQVYVYIGTKTTTGLDIEKAGLHNGKTYVVRVEEGGKVLTIESNQYALGTSTNRVTSTSFTLFDAGDASKLTEKELDELSRTNATSFFRVEDGAWDPKNPNDFYFLTTGRVENNAARPTFNNVTDATRLYRLRFADISNPVAGGTITLMLEGPAGVGNGLSDTQVVMMDNMGFTKDGKILIQEDPGNYDRLAKTWWFDPTTLELVELTRSNPRLFDTGGKDFLTRDEEASGIIDASDVLGEGWALYVIQAHYRTTTELVEGGQLGAMRITSVGRKAPNTTVEPYYKVSPAAAKGGFEVSLKSLVTVGDTNAVIPGGYKMVGIPDGLGAFDNGDGTFTLLMNHELRGGDLRGGNGTTTFTTNTTTGVITTNSNAAVGVVRAHGGKGSFVSEWVFRKSDLSVVRAGDLIKPGGVMLWDTRTGYRPFNPTNDFHISRLCSADLPEINALYNPFSGKGTTNRIFLNGEEDGGPFRPGQGGRAFAHIATGPEKGISYELPYLGKFAWENAVASPFPQDRTVVMGLDDSELTNSQVYVYIGAKRSSGSDIERAGLTGGKLFGIRVVDAGAFVVTETNDKVIGASSRKDWSRFILHDFGDVSRTSGDTLDVDSLGLLTNFQRVEDGAFDPNRPNDFYFLTTGRVENNATRATFNNVTAATRLWRVCFDDITRPELGGFVELVLEGPAGVANGLSHTQPVMMDNLGFTRDGRILLQEDPGNYDRLAKVWSFDPVNRDLTELAASDPKYFTTGNTNTFLTRDEEASGIIDVSDILGEGWTIWDIQVHNRLNTELVEGGQLVAMHTRPITAYPSIKVPPATQTVSVGSSVTLSVTPAGTGPFSYRWFWNGQLIAGATTPSITLYNLELNQAGDRVTVEVTGAEGRVTSPAAIIKVGPSDPQTELAMYPGLTLRGLAGANYRIEFRDAFQPTNQWTVLTNVVIPTSPHLWIDVSALGKAQRFYRAVAQ